MLGAKKKKAKFGDIIGIKTPKGFAYLQYTHKDPEYGDLLRVLPGVFDGEPDSLESLSNLKELYFVFFPLSFALSKELVSVVGYAAIPEWAVEKPFLRRAGGRAPTGKVLNWWLNDGRREWKVDKLSEEQKNWSLAAIWNDTLLIQRICEGWMPSKEI